MMSRIAHILLPEEKILFQTKLHKQFLIGPGLLTIYCLILFILYPALPNIILLIVSFVVLGAGLIKYTYTDYILTDRRFVRVSGYFFVHAEEYPLEKIDAVTCWQNWWTRILDTGIITLFGMGITTKKMRGLARAKDLRDAIHSQLSVEPVHYFD